MRDKKGFKKIESPLIQSYRQILGVGTDSTTEEIKKNYRQLAQRYHPDKNPNAEDSERFIKIQEAFQVLESTDQIEKLNKAFINEKLFGQVIEGLELTFGSFFGYRRTPVKLVDRSNRIGIEKASESDQSEGTYDFSSSDDSRSITDSAAFDSIELVFAGKFSGEDEARVRQGFGGRQVAQLPWIIRNNLGIEQFLASEFQQAFKTYDELNRRVHNNIIFLYRLAICHIVLGYKNQVSGFFGGKKPDKAHLRSAIKYLKRAIAIGEARSIGKQKCLLPRKTLADLYQVMGMKRQSRLVWRTIVDLQPKNKEARSKALDTRRVGLLGRRD